MPRPAPTPASRLASAKAERQHKKRERILDAAVHVFAKHGFYATRVSDIAKAAEVADGTIYLYFASKEEVLRSVFESRVERLLETVRADLPKQPSAANKLSAIISMQLGLLESERELAEVITVITRQSAKLMREYAAPKFLAYLDLIAAVVAEGQASGEFRKDLRPQWVARIVFGALDGLTMIWALGKADKGGLSRAAEQASSLILAGIRMPHAQAQPVVSKRPAKRPAKRKGQEKNLNQ
jgi:TetR/AcrR family transcriptional regulator, fatty acid metabolism regulator protein